jgi:large subunit ribosomal protein L15
VVYAKDYFGKHGFVNPTRKRLDTLNLYDIQHMIERGELDKEGDAYVLTFKGKVLGCGTLSHKVNVKALAFSKKAKEKIEALGGVAQVLE